MLWYRLNNAKQLYTIIKQEDHEFEREEWDMERAEGEVDGSDTDTVLI